MITQGLLLFLWIASVSGDTEILVSEPSADGLWFWTIKTDSQGAGWTHRPSVGSNYMVCDIGDSITKEPKNWLQTDFIDVRNATRLDIEITYHLLNCPRDSSQYCKTYFTLYSYDADTKDPVPDPTKGVFQKETVITPASLPPPGVSVSAVFRGSVVTKAKGIYLVFLDQGACVSITKVVISYRYCPAMGNSSVTFPRTIAPANDSDLVEQEGKCTDDNSVSKVKLSAVCLSNGEWNTTDDMSCLCNPGYELVNGSVAKLECKECPSGSYKNTINNTKCLRCPANADSNAERTACTCNKGFYNSSDLAECQALPQAPIQANATVVDTTYAVISWQRSPDDNGRLTYAVDCFRCISSNYQYCYETCSRQVQYSPRKENSTGVNVTVSGLLSSSFYFFRVYSVNELNQQETNRDYWKFAKVFIKTKGLPTTVPWTEASWRNASSTKIMTSTGTEESLTTDPLTEGDFKTGSSTNIPSLPLAWLLLPLLLSLLL